MKYFKEIKQDPNLNYYKIILKGDVDDADYTWVIKEVEAADFESNELLQLILCYLNTPINWGDNYGEHEYGANFDQDFNFAWLKDYLCDMDLIGGIEDRDPHSIVEVIVYHYHDGVCDTLKLDNFETIREDSLELREYIDYLYNPNNDLWD